jgi:hypothetical protein
MARLRARVITHLRPARWPLLLMLLVALAGCSVRLIQSHDDVIEKTVSDFHEDFLRFTTAVGRTRGTYQDNRGFYDKWQPKLKTLTARARWRPIPPGVARVPRLMRASSRKA